MFFIRFLYKNLHGFLGLFFLTLLLLPGYNSVFGKNTDSLLNVVNTSTKQKKIEALLSLSEELQTDSLGLSLEYSKQAIKEATALRLKSLLIDAFFLTGSIMKKMNVMDSALYYFELAATAAQKENNFEILGKTYHQIGMVYDAMSDYTGCVFNLHKALDQVKINNDSLLYVDVLIDLAYIYDFWGERDTTLACLQEAFKVSEKINYKKGVARSSIAMGNIYFSIENNEKALEYYEKTLTIAKEIDNKSGIGVSLVNIGAVYSAMHKNQFALKSLLAAIDVLININEDELLANAYTNIANVYADSGLYQRANEYLDKGLELFKMSGSKEDLAISMLAHSNVFYKASDYHKSNLYLDTCLLIAEEINFIVMEQECYQSFAKNYKALNNYKLAFEYQLQYDQLKDSLFTEKLQNQLIEFETKYKNEQSEREIEILQRDKELNELNLKRRRLERNAFLGGFILVILLILILYISFRDKSKANKLLAEKNDVLEKLTKEQKGLIAMKNKMISIIGHDLKNPFNSILGLSNLLFSDHETLRESDKKEIAQNIHLASKETYKLLENLLQWAKSQAGTSEFLPEKLFLNALVNESFNQIKTNAENKNIRLEKRVDESILVFADKNMLLTILRNLFSNAIKFSHNGSIITIEAQQDSHHTIIKIIDSGVGIRQDHLSSLFIVGKSYTTHGTANEKGSGLGLLICKEFVEKHGGKIEVESIEGKGSTFIVSLPIE